MIKKQGIILAEYLLGGGIINTAKDRIKKLVDEMPESKAGEIIDFLLYLKSKSEQELYLTSEEEKEIWGNIKNDQRMSSADVKNLLLREDND